MPSFREKGIILARTDYKEADRLYTILCEDGEVKVAIARGVRKPKAKLSAHLELFSEIDFMFASGRGPDIITSARISKTYGKITQDFPAVKLGFLMCEMFAKLTPQSANPENYSLAVETLAALDEGVNTSLIEIYFKLRLLDNLGYKPDLAAKTTTATGGDYYFSPADGAITAAGDSTSGSLKMSKDAIKLWRLCYGLPIRRLAKVKSAPQVAKQSLPVCNEFYSYVFGKKFKSEQI